MVLFFLFFFVFRCFFFFNDTATTEIYTLSLHDALPICIILRGPYTHFRTRRLRTKVLISTVMSRRPSRMAFEGKEMSHEPEVVALVMRSEEHTSELQSRQYLVCRLLLEKKKFYKKYIYYISKDCLFKSIEK